MKVNDWSSVDDGDRVELAEKDQKFLDWLEELIEDEYGWTRAVAVLTLQGIDDVAEIARRVPCARATVRRKRGIIAKLRAEFDRDYWWA